MKNYVFYRKLVLSCSLSVLVFFAIGASHDSLFINSKPLFKMILGLSTFALATYISFSIKSIKYLHLVTLIIVSLYAYIGICYGPLTAALLLSLFETNRQEAAEFFINVNYWYLLLPAVMFYFIVLFVKTPLNPMITLSTTTPKNDKEKSKNKKTFLAVFYFIGMYVYLLYPDYGFVKNSKHAIIDYVAYRHFIQQPSEDYHFPVSYKQNYKKNKFNIVIIGESVRQDYLSLYGYPLKTTPFLDKINGTFFNHYISASANTVPSLQLSLIVNKSNFRSPISHNVVNLAKSGGYKTYWLSNQGVTGLYDSLVAKVARNSDSVVSLKLGDFDSHNIDDFELLSQLEMIIQHQKNMMLSLCI